MLQFVHRHQKSLLGILMMAAIALVMTGFGLDVFSGSQQDQAAITVDDIEISYSSFYTEKRTLQERIEQQYRSLFGDNYYKYAASLFRDLNQQTLDRLITATLLNRAATQVGFFVSKDELRSFISKNLFPEGFDPVLYQSYLRQLGLTSGQFEQRLEQEVLRTQLFELLEDASRASYKEAKTKLLLDETAFDIDYITISATDLLEDVPEPSAERIEAFFTENASDYEQPDRITFDYALVTVEDALELVEVLPEDVEYYYAENEDDFVRPREAKVRQIKKDIAPGADKATRQALRDEIVEILREIQEGGDFGDLAVVHSDDIDTKLLGGDLGWVVEGRLAKDLNDAIFSSEDSGLRELVETSDAFYIFQVDEVKSLGSKPLEEVQSEIEEIIRKREAPAYASALALDLFEEWSSSGLSLHEFAGQKELGVERSELESAKTDGVTSPPGLTNELLSDPTQTKRTIELKDSTALAEIIDFRERDIPPLEETRTEVINAYNQIEADKLARAKAEEIVSRFDQGGEQKLADLAETLELEVQKEEGLTRTKGTAGVFADPDVARSVFNTVNAFEKPQTVHKVRDDYVVLQVTNITIPNLDESQDEIAAYRKRASRELSNTLLDSITEQLKAESKINHDPALLNN